MISMGLEPMTLPTKVGMLYRLSYASNKKAPALLPGLCCDLDGTRTHDSLIKSQVLYRLSYEIDFLYLPGGSLKKRGKDTCTFI